MPISALGWPKFFFYGKTKVVDLAEISIMVPSNYSLGEVSAHNYSYQKSPIFAGERMVHARYCVQDPTFIFAFVNCGCCSKHTTNAQKFAAAISSATTEPVRHSPC